MDRHVPAALTLVVLLLGNWTPGVRSITCASCNPCNATNMQFETCSSPGGKECYFQAVRNQATDNTTVIRGCESDQTEQTLVREVPVFRAGARMASISLQMVCNATFLRPEQSDSHDRKTSKTVQNVRILCHCGFDRCNDGASSAFPFPFDGSLLPNSASSSGFRHSGLLAVTLLWGRIFLR